MFADGFNNKKHKETYMKFYGVTFNESDNFKEIVKQITFSKGVKLICRFHRAKKLWYVEGHNITEVNEKYPELAKYEPIREPFNSSSFFDAEREAEYILENHGLIIKSISLGSEHVFTAVPTVDKPHKKNGRYRFFKGLDGAYVLSYINWAKDSEMITTVLHPEKDRVDQEIAVKYKAFSANEELLRKYKREIEQQELLTSFRSDFESDKYNNNLIEACFITDLPSDFYTIRKRIQYISNCYICKNQTKPSALGLKDNTFVIPLFRYDNLKTPASIQTIDITGQKLFRKGLKTELCVFPIYSKYNYQQKTPVKINKEDVYLCEGLATASSVMEMLDTLNDLGKYDSRRAIVLATFSIGNLEKVARALAGKHNLIICADNDHTKEGPSNVGLTVANRICAELGAILKVPQFPANLFKKSKELSDWNDFLLAITETNGEFKKLGLDTMLYYFYNN